MFKKLEKYQTGQLSKTLKHTQGHITLKVFYRKDKEKSVLVVRIKTNQNT